MVARPLREAQAHDERTRKRSDRRGCPRQSHPLSPTWERARVRGNRGKEGQPGTPPLAVGNVRRTKGGHSPLRMWGRCGRSIASIRLNARNTGKPWFATTIAQPHHTPETYQATDIDRSTLVADLLGFDTAPEPGDINTLTGKSMSGT